MSKIKVVFFEADPLSASSNGGAPRLELDAEVRRYREVVRASGNPHALEFDIRPAARTDDLLQALNEMCPRVVHFSGHGSAEGLVLVGADGYGTQCVDGEALRDFFKLFSNDVRVVVLNACFSLPQAEVIAEEVGCAIGTPHKISDRAAIIFGASFYRAIAFGKSVQVAYDQACAALSMEKVSVREYPQLKVRAGVDASQLILVQRGRVGRKTRLAVAGIAVTSVIAGALIVEQPPHCGTDWSGTPQMSTDQLTVRASYSATGGGRAEGRSNLASAKALQQAGDHAAAFPLFMRAAESGNPEAMGFVGIAYRDGKGTAPLADSAAIWLRKGASKRDLGAMTALAFAYQDGDAVRRSPYLARHWFLKAANEKSDPEAMRNLANIYRDDQKYDAALLWYRNAVKSGSLEARVDAGGMYEKGQGITRDPEQAQCLYRTAAGAGSLRGMVALGQLYENGLGVSRNYATAMKWYVKAAASGSPDAMNSIGELYRRGLGVPQSRAKAEEWFRRARDVNSNSGAGRTASRAN